MVGASRQWVTITLDRFQREGLIRVGRRNTVLLRRKSCARTAPAATARSRVEACARRRRLCAGPYCQVLDRQSPRPAGHDLLPGCARLAAQGQERCGGRPSVRTQHRLQASLGRFAWVKRIALQDAFAQWHRSGLRPGSAAGNSWFVPPPALPAPSVSSIGFPWGDLAYGQQTQGQAGQVQRGGASGLDAGLVRRRQRRKADLEEIPA